MFIYLGFIYDVILLILQDKIRKYKMQQSITAIRGAVLSFSDDPFQTDIEDCMIYESDAIIVMADGKITQFGPADSILESLPTDTSITHYRDSIITAGFIDTHVHYPQTPMIGAYGSQLLEWLTNYTFPTELKFKDKEFARSVAKMFLEQCLKAGTTTAMVYGTVFKDSVDAFFEESEKLNTRMLCGKVLMDRNAPEGLLDTPETGYAESKELIEKWHGNGRQLYAITPRFAPTSTDEQLALAGKLFGEYPDVFMQTHLCENKGEMEWVKELFPERKSYLDVYDHYGLVGKRSVFGHCVHFEDEDFKTLSEKQAAISHCPTSNLFLGSGLFDLRKAKSGAHPVHVGLGTDLGAGTSFSQLQSLGEAYKIAQLRDDALTGIECFYLATRGGTESLALEDKIGSIAPGMEADLVVLDLNSTPIIKYRMEFCKDIHEVLFVLMTMGDDRATKATYVAGNLVYEKDE